MPCWKKKRKWWYPILWVIELGLFCPYPSKCLECAFHDTANNQAFLEFKNFVWRDQSLIILHGKESVEIAWKGINEITQWFIPLVRVPYKALKSID